MENHELKNKIQIFKFEASLLESLKVLASRQEEVTKSLEKNILAEIKTLLHSKASDNLKVLLDEEYNGNDIATIIAKIITDFSSSETRSQHMFVFSKKELKDMFDLIIEELTSILANVFLVRVKIDVNDNDLPVLTLYSFPSSNQ
jgi:type I site-specific restriction endonuclease